MSQIVKVKILQSRVLASATEPVLEVS